MVTNRRLLKVTGILNKRSADSSLEKINDAVLSQSILGRMFNYGDLEILTAAEQAVDRYHMLKPPQDIQEDDADPEAQPGDRVHVPAAAHAAAARRRRKPAARRCPPAPAPPAAAPACRPAPAAAPAGAHAATEPTSRSRSPQTLARLADLRDKGAITRRGIRAEEGRAARPPVSIEQLIVQSAGRVAIIILRRLSGSRVQPRLGGVPPGRLDRPLAGTPVAQPARPFRSARRHACWPLSALLGRLLHRLGQADAGQPLQPALRPPRRGAGRRSPGRSRTWSWRSRSPIPLR